MTDTPDLKCYQEAQLLKVLTSLSYRQDNLSTYLTNIVCGLSQLIKTDWSVVTLRQQGQYRILASSIEIKPEKNYNLHDTFTNDVLTRGATLFIEDISVVAARGPEGYFAYLGIPLRTPIGEVIGTICSFFRQPHTVMPEEIQLAEVLAEQAAVAIDNYQLYQRQRRAKTQYRQMSEQLEQTNTDLKNALQLKDNFLANMSHELRTPLTAIIGLAEVLQDKVYGPLTPKQNKSVETIEQSGQHLLAMINDLLDLSKLESGNLALQLNAVSLESLAASSLASFQRQAQAKHITLLNQVSADVGELIGDEIRLRQILLNLLSNAIKFTPEGGEITVSAQTTGTAIELSVTDTGIGIATDDFSKLFQPFVQLDSARSRHYGGTGLGLVLVQRIAALHSGTVHIESQVGQGSRFTVTLPSNLEPQAKSPSMENTALELYQPQESLAPLILLAEDREPILLLLSDYLEEAGYRVETAKDGPEVIELAQTYHPDLIFMDIRLPQIDGLEATRQIKLHLPHTPIIALTSLLPENEAEFRAAGFSDALVKPLKMEQLTQMITKHLKLR